MSQFALKRKTPHFLWVGNDGEYCDFSLLWAVAPKNPNSSWGVLLSVSFKNRLFFVERIREARKLVGLERRGVRGSSKIS